MYAGGKLQETTFTMHVGRDGLLWLVPGTGDPENIWLHDPSTLKRSPAAQGMGGATLTFPLEDGRGLALKAPWMSNPEALLEHTGIDLTGNYLSRVTVSLDQPDWVGGGYSHLEAEDVLYTEDTDQVGTWNRGRDVAQRVLRQAGATAGYIIVNRNGLDNCEAVTV